MTRCPIPELPERDRASSKTDVLSLRSFIGVA